MVGDIRTETYSRRGIDQKRTGRGVDRTKVEKKKWRRKKGGEKKGAI